MQTYIIELDSSTGSGKSVPDRGSFFENRKRLGEEARHRIVSWLEAEGLWPQVKHLGDPTAFLTVNIVCTPEVAEKLRNAPGVKAVIGDAPMKRL